jgi:hypothetical protein
VTEFVGGKKLFRYIAERADPFVALIGELLD